MKKKVNFKQMTILFFLLLWGLNFSQAQTTIDFNFTGADQSWIVPTGVTSISIEAWGAEGGSAGPYGVGGLGGYASGDLSVTPGETLYIYVGGSGEGGPNITPVLGGYNGGGDGNPSTCANPQQGSGGGGGASDVRQGGTNLSDRMIVAGGGGGSGLSFSSTSSFNASGGHGGGLIGGDSRQLNANNIATGGTQVGGGIAGADFSGCEPGFDGVIGIGGDGHENDGGGGGGGFYGGGGGAANSGGGGGSSYIGGVSNGITVSAERSGNGLVKITYIEIDPCDPINGDSDCDGVSDECDVCPGGDDSIDNNNDGIADCSQLLSYNDYSDEWYCSNNKINICHNGNTLCVNKNALPAHFNHGDYVGPCTSCEGEGLVIQEGGAVELNNTIVPVMDVFPNPTSSKVNIHLHGLETEGATLTIYDNLGRVVYNKNLDYDFHYLELNLPDENFSNGQYVIQLIAGDKVLTKSLMIEKN